MTFCRFGAVPEPLGTQHRRQGQGHEARKHHCRRQGKAEFGKQSANVAAHEGDGNEHRHQGQSGRNHGEGNLLRAPVGGKQRGLTLVNPALDVFQHYDGIVHHQADGKNHRQQGQYVDGKTQEAQTDKGTNHRNRNGHRGNEGRPPGAQEQEDNQDNQRHCDGERGDHFLDGSPNENGFVVAFRDGDFRWQCLPDLLQLGADGIGNRNGVGLGLADNPHADGGLAIGAQAAHIRLHTHLDIGHLAQAQQIITIPANHKLPELFHVRQPALGPHGEIPGGRIHRSCRKLHVVGTQGPFHFRHGDIPGRKTFAVQPDPDGIAPFAANTHVGNTIEYRQPVRQDPVGKVTQFGTVPDITAQGHPHHRACIGIRLAHHRWIGFIWQLVGHPGHRITDIIGGNIHIPGGGKFNTGSGLALLGG